MYRIFIIMAFLSINIVHCISYRIYPNVDVKVYDEKPSNLENRVKRGISLLIDSQKVDKTTDHEDQKLKESDISLEGTENFSEDLVSKFATPLEPLESENSMNLEVNSKGSLISYVKGFSAEEDIHFSEKPDPIKTTSVYVDEDVQICWVEITTIKEDKYATPPNRLVIKEYAISFEHAELTSDDHANSNEKETESNEAVVMGGINENVRTSRVNSTSTSNEENGIVQIFKNIQCSVGPVVTKDVHEWKYDGVFPKKRVEIKVGPKLSSMSQSLGVADDISKMSTLFNDSTSKYCKKTSFDSSIDDSNGSSNEESGNYESCDISDSCSNDVIKGNASSDSSSASTPESCDNSSCSSCLDEDCSEFQSSERVENKTLHKNCEINESCTCNETSCPNSKDVSSSESVSGENTSVTSEDEIPLVTTSILESMVDKLPKVKTTTILSDLRETSDSSEYESYTATEQVFGKPTEIPVSILLEAEIPAVFSYLKDLKSIPQGEEDNSNVDENMDVAIATDSEEVEENSISSDENRDLCEDGVCSTSSLSSAFHEDSSSCVSSDCFTTIESNDKSTNVDEVSCANDLDYSLLSIECPESSTDITEFQSSESCTSAECSTTVESQSQKQLVSELKIQLERINEEGEKEKVTVVKKKIPLGENLFKCSNETLMEHIKNLNESIAIQTIQTLLNCSIEVFENDNVDADVPTSTEFETDVQRHRRSVFIPFANQNTISSMNQDIRKEVEMIVSEIQEDVIVGLNRILFGISDAVNTGLNITDKPTKSSLSNIFRLLSQRNDVNILQRMRRSSTHNTEHFINFVEPVDQWSHVRVRNLDDKHSLQSITEFTIYKEM